MAVRLALALLVVLLLAGCGGGAFAPDSGAFLGKFSSAEAAEIGDLSFTADTSGVAGTGLIHDGMLDINVAISANVSGQNIAGYVSNSYLGSGTFIGSFSNSKTARGTFTFDIVTGGKVTGTWTAAVE